MKLVKLVFTITDLFGIEVLNFYARNSVAAKVMFETGLIHEGQYSCFDCDNYENIKSRIARSFLKFPDFRLFWHCFE
jgi:hypothetical protein